MVFWGVVIAVVVAVALLVPFLIREIGKGKAELKPGTPDGAGDVKPGRRGNPAPGQPDAQADPDSPQAHRP